MGDTRLAAAEEDLEVVQALIDMYLDVGELDVPALAANGLATSAELVAEVTALVDTLKFFPSPLIHERRRQQACKHVDAAVE